MGNASGRFFGKVGYIETVEDNYGVARPVETVHSYYGNVLSKGSRWQETEKLNDDISADHRISILADPYAYEHFPYIRYVEWMGTRWEVKSVKESYPRLILTLGGVYNGAQA